MSTPTTYDKDSTALLFVDPYNDFLSEGGRIWPRVKQVAQQVGPLDNLRIVNRAVRCARRSWRVPAGGSPVRVRGSARPVASVASWKVTTTAKRTQQSCGVWD